MGEREGEANEAMEALEESRFRRGMRYGHRGGLYASLVVAIAVLVFIILLIARNTRKVKLDYVFGAMSARLIWLVIISTIAGWVLGLLTGFLVRHRTRAPR